jgi:hypothetical protein
MKRIALSVLVSVGLLASTTLLTAPAEAAPLSLPQQTIHVGTAKTAWIRPVLRLPSGAKVVRIGLVTVKSTTGKVFGSNKTKVSVGKGSYRATSSIAYRPLRRRSTTVSVWAVSCRVSQKTIQDDRTDYVDGGGYISDYLSGQATVGYAGSCTGYRAGTFNKLSFTGAWSSDEYFVCDTTPDADRLAVLLACSDYKLGDVTYPSDLTSATVVTKYYGPTTTQTTVRTVRVVR